MTVRAMTAKQAEFVKTLTDTGTVQRHCDVVKASTEAKVPFLFLMARAKFVSRGKYDFTKAREAALLVLDGKTDPTAPVKAEPKAKAKTNKAPAKSKSKATTVKSKTKGKISKPAVQVKVEAAVAAGEVKAPTTQS